MNEIKIENVDFVSGGHCGQDSPLRAAGCEVGYHVTEFIEWLFA